MNALLRALSCSLVLFASHLALLRADDLQQTKVGAAKIDITPEYRVRLTGYGNRREESQGVAQQIWAKAIAIGDDAGGGPAVWIMYENCGLTPDIRTAVADALHKNLKVKPDQLAISVTHSHTAPALTNWAPFIFGTDIPPEHQARIDQYTRELTNKLIQVASGAITARKPATLHWGQGQARFAANRRVLKDGKWSGFGVQPDGPVDHRLPVLAAKDSQGKLIACVVNYACHCTTLGGNFNQIAGDWAGYAQEYIESDHPGCIALTTIGCGADANPNPRGDDLALCQQHGRALSDEVKRVLASELRTLDASLHCRMLTIDLPYQKARTIDEWRERAKSMDATGYHARHFLARLERGEPIPTQLPSYPIASWSFGRDLAIVFLGGEVVVDYAIRMSKEFDADRLWITAYSNDVPCYIPSKRVLQEGGYEADRSMVYYGRPQSFSPDVEDLIIDAVQKLLPHWFYSSEKQVDFPPPKSPEEALASIKVPTGLKVELVAAEPLVEDPVAFDWAPDGRLWVAEMRDYPNGMAWDKPGDRVGVPGGRIKLLTDDDGDGRYDRASLFLENVPFPNGVKAWRNGVLVTAAPNIFYAEDTNGDGIADRSEVLFQGFVEGNQQHRANGLRWGIDNWLYVANGDSGGKVKSIRTGQEVSISGRDLRIRPDTGEIEAQSGQTQFGRCSDDWGNWFGGNNSNPLWHYVLDDHYLRRNRHYTPPAVRRDVPEVPGAAPVFPTSRTLARFNDFHTANRFTSACSPEIYRDVRLNRVLGENGLHVFICEPVHNLVNRQVMTTEGVSFKSRRAEGEESQEFFASSDNWSRPVMVRTGPDGAIWIADMYRQVIEHPEWIPLTSQRKLDLRAGSDRGRIYRVTLANEPTTPLPRLVSDDLDGLIKALSSPNGWQRDTAQQMLIWRGDERAVPLLTKLAGEGAKPTARLHALATLDGMQRLAPELVRRALHDPHYGVRRHAVRLAEQFANSGFLAIDVARLADDQDPFVRQQVACSLGEFAAAIPAQSPSPTTNPALHAQRALAEIALGNANDPYIVAAVMSSLCPQNEPIISEELLLADPPAVPLIKAVLSIASRWEQSEASTRLLTRALNKLDSSEKSASAQFTQVASILEAVGRSKISKNITDADTLKRLNGVFQAAEKVARDDQSETSDRLAAVRLLSVKPEPTQQLEEVFVSLIGPQNPTELQAAAVSALDVQFPKSSAGQLLQGWKSHSPAIRAQILDLVLTRPAGISTFLASVEQGSVAAAHVDARRRQLLMNHPDATIRERSRQLFGAEVKSNRAEVLERHQAVLNLAGNVAQGKTLFAKKCATCHRLEETGQNVGPDLLSLTDKSPRSLLVAILDPNRAVEDKFLDYVAVTNDGLQFTGMIANETSTSVTLVGQEGKQAILRRADLEVLQSSGKSLMPEGLEADLKPQDFADVIAYVRSISAPPKSFPGNVPELAHVRDDGSIRLLAMNAKIYGPTLVFEQKYRNLGYWQRPEDHAVWMMNVPKAGVYSIAIDYACEDSSAGDRFVLAVGDQIAGGIVVGTGSWDVYRSRSAGKITLAEGPAELILRSDGPIRNALFDVRQIVLEPE